MMKKQLMVPVLAFLPVTAMAIEPIPQESGFSGYINLGAGGVNMKSNMVAGIFGQEFSDAKVSSFSSEPDAETSLLPMVAGEIRYTLGESRTQFFVGNLLEDFLRFDSATQFGVRQEAGQVGTFGVALLNSQIPAEVWKDPYVIGVSRSTTKQNASGYRISWDKVFGTNLELTYTQRELEIDEEWSGLTQLGVPFAAYQTLQREGTVKSLEAAYVFRLGDTMTLVPSIRAVDRDLDGKAMANDGYTLLVTHTWAGDQWELLSNISWGNYEYDGINPLFLDTDESSRMGVSVTAFYKEPFGLKGWRAVFGVAHFNEENDIDFYDSEATMLSAGMLYRF
ncbi:MAG: DUF2860 domain-containing protein [Gammaproteobacteria bacterium]|nr:MAG: DUF2860 domain-containing protein [Gammaproteobacteria bacterium]